MHVIKVLLIFSSENQDTDMFIKPGCSDLDNSLVGTLISKM